MTLNLPVVIDQDALPALSRYVRDQGLNRLALIVDDNTYRVLGQRVEQQLIGQGCDVKTIRLAGAEPTPDEEFLYAGLHGDGRRRAHLPGCRLGRDYRHRTLCESPLA